MSDHGFETVFADQQDEDAAPAPRDALDIDVVTQAVRDEQQVGCLRTPDHLFQCAADFGAAPRRLQGRDQRGQFRRRDRLAGAYGLAFVVEFPQRDAILGPQLAGQTAERAAHRFVTAHVPVARVRHGARRMHRAGMVHQHREVQVGIALAGRLDPQLDGLAVAAPALQQAGLPSVDLQVDGHVGRHFRHQQAFGFGLRADPCQANGPRVMPDAHRHLGRRAAMDEVVGLRQAREPVDLAHGHRDAQPSVGPRAPQHLGPARGDLDRGACREVGHGQRVDAPQDLLVQHGGLALLDGFLVRLAGLGATLRHAVQHALPDARGQPEERGLHGNRDRQQGFDGILLLVAKGALRLHEREAPLDGDADGHRRERNGLPLAFLPPCDECRDRVDQAFLGSLHVHGCLCLLPFRQHHAESCRSSATVSDPSWIRPVLGAVQGLAGPCPESERRTGARTERRLPQTAPWPLEKTGAVRCESVEAWRNSRAPPDQPRPGSPAPRRCLERRLPLSWTPLNRLCNCMPVLSFDKSTVKTITCQVVS